MCRPRKEKINWEDDLPPALVPPPVLDLDQLPMLNMIPFVNVNIMTEDESESDNSEEDLSNINDGEENSDDSEQGMSEGPMESDVNLSSNDSADMSYESGDEEKEANLVPSFCLNNPKLVWPSDSDSEVDEEASKDIGGPPLGEKSEIAPAIPGYPLMSVERGRGARGRNMARRSRPFFGK